MADARTAVRAPHLAPKVVFVDGQPGCGKTMLSPIVGALPRVELLQYFYEGEYTCAMDFLSLIDRSASVTMIRMLTDLRLYNLMMSRDTNFRRGDLSSVFMNSRPWRYLTRLFQPGNEHVLPRIAAERPILHLATHNLLGISTPIVEGLGDRAVFVEVVRHPLYMIRQQALYTDRYGKDVRDFTVWHTAPGGAPVPFFAAGWEEQFLAANAWERAILFMERWERQCAALQAAHPAWWESQVLLVPFERFVLEPHPYMAGIERALGTSADDVTRRMMKTQCVPRTRIAGGLNLPIYQQYGWQPPLAAGTERGELAARRADAAAHVSPEALERLDRLSGLYEAAHLSDLPALAKSRSRT